MTSYETAELLNGTIDSLNKTENLHELLFLGEGSYKSYQGVLYEAVNTGDNVKRAGMFDTIQEALLHSFLPKLVGVRSRKVYADLESVLSTLAALRTIQAVDESEDIVPLTHLTSTFIDRYEEFLHTRTPGSTLDLLNVGHELLLSIKLFVDTLRLIERNLEGEPVAIPPQCQAVSLFLSSENNYKDVLTKLNSVNDLYSELCNLVGVSSAEYPLQIIKIETGSLWLKVFGESRVISLLIKFIESGASFMYRRFTTEGQIQSIPRQVEAIEAVLHLTENLERVGVDTTQAKDNLQKSTVLISNQLNSLLQGVTSVKINDETLSISKAFEAKFLKESRGLFLEEQNERAEGDKAEADSDDGKTD